MIGRAWLRLNRTFNKGLQVAWYRDIVRPRILRTAPIEADDSSVCEIHVMTSESDWLNLVWALKSFYHASGRLYALCIHDDGTLTSIARASLKKHFPRARLLDRPDAEQIVLASLSRHPRCQAFRASNHLAPKVFDFHYFLTAERMLLLDSDVLFFKEPTELLKRIEDPNYQLNSVNADVDSSYTVDPAEVKNRFNFDLIPRFNSGLGVIHRESLNLNWMEEFLTLPDIIGHFWRIEQTLFALCSCRYGVQLLPASYDVFLAGQLECQQSRHYVGKVRHLMYSEGIRLLSKASRQW